MTREQLEYLDDHTRKNSQQVRAMESFQAMPSEGEYWARVWDIMNQDLDELENMLKSYRNK